MNQETGEYEMLEQDANIDGENFTFKKFIKYQVLHQGIDVVVDVESMLE